jgi:hypothetical protein
MPSPLATVHGCIGQVQITKAIPFYCESILERLHRNQREIVDEPDFFLDKGLGIADTGEGSVVSGFRECALANFFLGYKQSTAGGLIRVLRGVGH